MQYLRALRLSEARLKMLPAMPVTEVATQFGFWHLRYFSSDYQISLDELPSKTLQRWRTGGGVKDTRSRRLQGHSRRGYWAASEAVPRIASATSSTVPNRPIGMVFTT